MDDRTLPIAACLAALLLAAGPLHAQRAPADATQATGGGRNVYATGGEVRLTAPVGGDFTAAGGKVLVDQPVSGDAMLAGGSVDVRAPVGDDLRSVGGDVRVEGSVGGELLATGGHVAVARAATVARGATLYGGSVNVEGRIDGDLQATARKVVLDGEVRGNARLAAEEVELGPRARIAGNLAYASATALKRADGATVVGAVTREEAPAADAGPGPRRPERPQPPATPWWAAGVLSFLALLGVASLLLLVAPGLLTAGAERLRSSPWPALGAGFATLLAVPVVVVLLCITLLGIPLGLALLVMSPALLLAGFLAGVQFVAGRLAIALGRPAGGGFAASVAFFALGLLLVLFAANLPFAGALAVALLSVAGLGGCVLALVDRRRRGSAGARGPGTAMPAAAA